MLSEREATRLGLERVTFWKPVVEWMDTQWGHIRAGEWVKLEALRIGTARRTEVVEALDRVAIFQAPLTRAERHTYLSGVSHGTDLR